MQMAQGQVGAEQAKQLQGVAGAVKQITDSAGTVDEVVRANEGV
jgi:hypothetical protein